MPARPPRLKTKPIRKAWASPGKNARRRQRGRRGVEDRRRVLSEEPLCRMCAAEGLITPSEEVDHIRDDLPDDEWDSRANKQGLCKRHHAEKTAAEALRARKRRQA